MIDLNPQVLIVDNELEICNLLKIFLILWDTNPNMKRMVKKY